MSCRAILQLVKGNLEIIPYTLLNDTLSFTFNTSGVSVIPAIGDIYTIDSTQFLVTSVDGSQITFQSYLKQNTDEQGAQVVPASGTLTRSTGTGDASITYSAFTSDYLYDTTDRDVKLRILTEVVDEPTPSQVVIEKTATQTGKGVGVFEFTVTETSDFTPGQYYGVLEIYRSDTDIIEQRDDEVFTVNISKNKV